MSVIQYWNSETTAVVSSKTQRENNIAVTAETPADNTIPEEQSVFPPKRLILLLYYQNNTLESPASVQLHSLHLGMSPFNQTHLPPIQDSVFLLLTLEKFELILVNLCGT